MRRFGWKKDPAKLPGETPDRLAGPKLRALPPPPLSASCAQFILDILDQGQLGSCTCNAFAQALRAAMIRAGAQAPELVARLFLYFLARAYDHDTANDDGTFLRNVAQAAVKYGFPEEHVWPYSDDSGPDAPFRKMPPISAFWAAIDRSARFSKPQYFRIESYGAQRIEDVKRAIAAGHCIAFGTDVSEDFSAGNLGTGPIPPPVGLPIAGGHALTIAGYDAEGVDVVNSWGDSWGNKGWCRFSWDYITWDKTDDLWIVEVSPLF